MALSIDYLGHSGFFVETGRALMLFDYFRGDISFISRRQDDKPLFVFVSHAHRDHFNPAIFTLSNGKRAVKYLLSFDLNGDDAVPDGLDISYLDADNEYPVEGLGSVRTLVSTDEGVAFLVCCPEAVLFHAGDLNWWDWPGEDEAWLSEQERVFKREIGRIADAPIDAAFVVLDDRLEENYDSGMKHFLSVCKAKCILPMHFTRGESSVQRFMEDMPKGSANLLDTSRKTHFDIN